MKLSNSLFEQSPCPVTRLFALVRKELKSWAYSPAFYGITVFFLVFLSVRLFYFSRFFAMDTSSLRPFFEGFPLAYIPVIPVLTMKAWAEEKKLGSIELLFTLPFTERELVLGKFFASLTALFIMLLLTLPVPLSIMPLGHFDPGVIFTQYAGALLFGTSAIALGLFLSSVSKNQSASFLGSAAVLITVTLANNITQYMPRSVTSFVNFISLAFHFESFSRGLLDSRDIIFFLLSTVFFLFLNANVLYFRKYS